MRLPRVRLTIRQAMIAVAVVAVVLAIRIENNRIRKHCLDAELRSLDHSLAAMRYEGRRVESRFGPLEDPSSVRDPRKAAYHHAMARKWGNAAQHPWLPVEPDPLEPE